MAIWLDGLQAVLEVFVGLLTSVFLGKKALQIIYRQDARFKDFNGLEVGSDYFKITKDGLKKITSISQTLNQMRFFFLFGNIIAASLPLRMKVVWKWHL